EEGRGSKIGITLRDGETFDMSLIRIRFLNEFNTLAAYVTSPVRFEIDDEEIIRLAGPGIAASQGGMTGTIVRTAGKKGTAHLTIRTDMAEPVTVEFTVE
ncbi:MAG: hypothetical protein J6U61_09635, partial [Lachnospiraceae bacterium]|nr:hypothetical protein [Lachnospiraceae bacterium]